MKMHSIPYCSLFFLIQGTLGELGTVVEGLPLMATLLTLIGELTHYDLFVRAAAFDQIKRIADARGVTLRESVCFFFFICKSDFKLIEN
jgi:hypothetical protein